MMDLPPGRVLVTARSYGYAPFVGSTTVVEGNDRDVRIGLRLETHAEGQVRDSDGEPVAGCPGQGRTASSASTA